MSFKIYNYTPNKFRGMIKILKLFVPFAKDRLKFDRDPIIKLLDREHDKAQILGKTAFYDPEKMIVSVYTYGRHPKDIMRSIAHELVHHAQACRGDLGNQSTPEGYAQNDKHLRKMEKEAYLEGNMCFRDFEDEYKSNLSKEKKLSLQEWREQEIFDRLLERFTPRSKKVNERTLGLHGAGMSPEELQFGDDKPELNKTGKVTPEEADLIAKKISTERPEKVYAYSRGSAVLNKAVQDDDLDAGSLPPVVYVAPAALRGWTDAPVPKLPAGSETYIGDKDAAVPVKQACKIAQAAGTPLKVMPDKSHVSVMYGVKDNAPSYEVDANACASDPEMPDWGSEKIDKTDPRVAQQQQRIKIHIKRK